MNVGLEPSQRLPPARYLQGGGGSDVLLQELWIGRLCSCLYYNKAADAGARCRVEPQLFQAIAQRCM